MTDPKTDKGDVVEGDVVQGDKVERPAPNEGNQQGQSSGSDANESSDKS